MSIQDLFQKNPFQNLVIASRDAASFNLRGHEQQFEAALEAIRQAVRDTTYQPERLRHTIVFGEWGHGKTHLLRSIELMINRDLSSAARAIYYEPSSSDPDLVISELAAKAGLDCTKVSEFVAALQADGRHQFLLIDESQALVGENIHGNYDSEIGGYYGLLGKLLEESNARHVNLHIFHGLSANSAKAIDKMRAIPTILKLAKNVFTLNSLSEEDQWHMVRDHVMATLKGNANQEIENIISKTINRTVNRLTGGNPRWVLMLMHDIYLHAVGAERDNIDERTCYEALRQTIRIDEPSRKYFDPFLIDELLERLRNGQTHEQRIAALLSSAWSSLLGGWSTVSQAQLASHELTAAQARKECPSVRNLRLLEQTPDADFRPTHELLDELKITTWTSIHQERDRERLLRLSLQPQKMLRQIVGGFESVLRGCNRPPNCEHNFGGMGLDALFFDEENLNIGLAIYKGIEVPLELYQASASRLEEGGCAVIVLIEDTLGGHDKPSSTFQRFKGSYSGPILVEKRFLFINGSDGDEGKFGEDFFVSLLDTNIDGTKARALFERVRLKSCIERAVSESVYCPTEQERQLILRLLGTGSRFNLSELRALDSSFDWVTMGKLSALSDFIEKSGSKYSRRPLEDIKPIKHLLKTLSEKVEGIPLAELESQVRHTWILTGTPEATQLFPTWCLTLIENQGLLKRENAIVRFKDIEKDASDLLAACEKLAKEIDKTIQEYKIRFAPERTQHQEVELSDLNQRVRVASAKELTERGNLLKACEADARLLRTSLAGIPDLVRADLEKELAHIVEVLGTLKEMANWPYPDLDNPSLRSSRALEGRLTPVKAKIEASMPFEIEVRKDIELMRIEIEVNIEELSKPVPEGVEAPSGETSIDQSVFYIFSALRSKRNGHVTIEYADMIVGDATAKNEEVKL
jgi:hypothetical protein